MGLYTGLLGSLRTGLRPGNMRRLAVLAAVLAAGCGETEERPASAGMILELYNVQDMVHCIWNIPPCDIPDDPEGCNQFVEEVRRSLPQISWNQEEGKSLVIQNGLLIVRAPIDTHLIVREFLANERARLKSVEK